MAAFENEDLTVSLPGDLLQKVFGYLPLRDKLRLESVDHRFQRCILDMLERKPLPLELDMRRSGTLNGHKIQDGRLLDALRSFANKTKFNSISIDGRSSNWTRYLDSVLSTLIESEKCLEKVTCFKTNCKCSQEILETITAKCPKLSVVCLDFVVHSRMDLSTALNNKALTQLNLTLSGHPLDRVLNLFRSLKPNTLRKLTIAVMFSKQHAPPTLNLAQLVNELRTSAWAALQELTMGIRLGTKSNNQLAEFVDSLALMPSLHKCRILYDTLSDNQFVPAMNSLFKSSINMTLRSSGSFFHGVPGCQIISQIKQVQTVHQGLKVNFTVSPDSVFPYLNLSLNSVYLNESVRTPSSCDNANCVDCHRFYPNVLWKLKRKARHLEDKHLEGYQLDRCRISDVVDHLKNDTPCEFVPTGASETQGLVTISFGTRHQPSQEFNITVASGRCFSNSCVKCIDIELL